MQWFRFAVLVLVTSVVQAGFADLVSIGHQNVRPDLLLILLVFFATHGEGRDAVITSFVIGLAADLAHPGAGLMGPRILSYGLLGTLLSDLNSVLLIRRMSHQAIAIFVVGAFVCLLSFALARLRVPQSAAGLGRELYWQPLLSALIGPFLFWPVAWWMRISRKRRLHVR